MDLRVTGRSQLSIPIPSLQSLVAVRVCFQAAALDPGSGLGLPQPGKALVGAR